MKLFFFYIFYSFVNIHDTMKTHKSFGGVFSPPRTVPLPKLEVVTLLASLELHFCEDPNFLEFSSCQIFVVRWRKKGTISGGSKGGGGVEGKIPDFGNIVIFYLILRPLDVFNWQGEYFRCPPPIILIFGYVIEDRKIRNTCFFIFPRFHILGGENCVQS